MTETTEFQQTLERVAERFAKSRSMRRGNVLFRLTGSGGGTYVVECGDGQARVITSPAAEPDTAPLIEVIGDAARVRAVLSGAKDARMQFLAGAFRVRGNLRYLSDAAVELGLLEKPL